MTEYLARSEWTSASRGGSEMTGTQLVGVAVHWPGSSTPEYGVESKAAVASRLRGWRDYHVNGRGWSDIGYNVAIDQAGRVWDLRGIGRVGAHCASSSNPDANHEWMGVLLILGAREQPTQAMLTAFRHFRTTVFLTRWSGRTQIRGHGQVPGAQTSCPGSRVRELISDGALAQPPDDEGGNDMSWDYTGLDYVNDDATTKDHQLARAHQYSWALHRNMDEMSWSFHGVDFVNENPSSKDWQVGRAHHYTYKGQRALFYAGSTNQDNQYAVRAGVRRIDNPLYPGTEDDPEWKKDEKNQRRASWRYALQQAWRFAYWAWRRLVSVESKIDRLQNELTATRGLVETLTEQQTSLTVEQVREQMDGALEEADERIINVDVEVLAKDEADAPEDEI